MDRYPGDLLSEIRKLQADVAELQALLGARPASTEASQGWVLRAMSTPALPPAGDVHIYASGGRLRARSTVDDVALTDVPQGTAPDALVVSAGGAVDGEVSGVPASYDQNAINSNFREVSVKINELISELVSVGFLT